MKTIDSLPPEIMHLILHPAHFRAAGDPGYCLPKYYIILRLVSQTFCAIVTPHIFKDLHIRSLECSLQRLKSIAESDNVKNLVKSYSYSLYRSRFSNISYDRFLRYEADPTSLPDPEAISPEDTTMLEFRAWGRQCEFDLSGDLHELHVKHLATLPNLTSISFHLADMTTGVDYHISNKQWGPIAFRAVLLAMYNRTLLPDVAPVETLIIDEISEECMTLPPSVVAKAVAGIRNIKNLTISIRIDDGNLSDTSPGWILLVGRLIQSIASLESLEIDTEEHITEIPFRSLVTPYKLKPGAGPEPLFPSIQWPNLKKLLLNDLVFAESHILGFIAAHRKTLNFIDLFNCCLEPDNEVIKNLDTNDSEPPPRINPWLTVFRAIYAHFPPKSTSALSFFHVDELYFGKRRPKRMRNCQALHWAAYIIGELPSEPSNSMGGSTDCENCRDERGSSDDGETTDESDDGYFFGAPGFGFGLWDDEDDGFDEESDIDSDDGDLEDDLYEGGPPPHLFFGGFEY